VPAAEDEAGLGEIYFEFTASGRSVKVVAIHAASGVEVSAVAPAGAARADLQRLVLQKLKARLASDQKL
jgi:hypothetical protein